MNKINKNYYTKLMLIVITMDTLYRKCVGLFNIYTTSLTFVLINENIHN